MALLLHAISTAELTNIQREALSRLGLCCHPAPPLCGLATPCATGDVEEAGNDRLVAYSHLVEAAANLVDIIPVRYGTVFDDSSTLQQALERNCRKFDRQLQEISGCVEMSIRVALDTAAKPAQVALSSRPLSGQEYLEARKQQTRDWQSALTRVTAAVANCYLKKKTRYLASQSLLYIYFLVEKPRLEQFKAAINSLQGIPIFLSGPWSAGSFVD